MRAFVKTHFPAFFSLLHKSKESYYSFLGHYFPEKLLKDWYKAIFHEDINLDAPRNICEKICWMKLHADTSLWTRCADKYAVRKYVEERGLGSTLNELYGVYEDATEINFDLLPEQFVLKTNNGGGGNNVIIVQSKPTLNIKGTANQLNGWLKHKIGYRWVEPHYRGIKPLVIAEKYLQPEAEESSLLDYKFYCFDGRVHSVFFCSDRSFGESVHYSTYDLDWHYQPEKTISKYRTDKIYAKPRSLDKMIEYSSILSKGIPFVRVDWYEIDGEPVFGEMTFTPGGGFLQFHSMDYLIELGDQLILPPAIR